MGEVEIAGDDALAAVQRIASNDARKLEPGRAQYSALTTPEGTVVDDLLVYQLAAGHYLLVINAANIAKDVAWIRKENRVGGGRGRREHEQPLRPDCAAGAARRGDSAGPDRGGARRRRLLHVREYTFASGEVANVRATISRTGYTGEDGFELFVPPA